MSSVHPGATSLTSQCSALASAAHCLSLIVCMLIALRTGRKPTLRTLEMIRFYFTGWASEEELMAHIAKLQAAKE